MAWTLGEHVVFTFKQKERYAMTHDVFFGLCGFGSVAEIGDYLLA